MNRFASLAFLGFGVLGKSCMSYSWLGAINYFKIPHQDMTCWVFELLVVIMAAWHRPCTINDEGQKVT